MAIGTSGRLASGVFTNALQPLGTASDGLSTTFLFVAVSPETIITTISGAFTTQTLPLPNTRTVIASASGWVETFNTTTGIVCRLVNTSFGECFDGTSTVPANTGIPFAEVFPISAAQVTSSHKPPVGAIVGGVLGGLAVLLLALALCLTLWWRRLRQLQEVEKLTYADPYDAQSQSATPTPGSGKQLAPIADGSTNVMPFDVSPQSRLSRGIPRRKGGLPTLDTTPGQPVVQNETEAPTMQQNETDMCGGQDTPPAYPGRLTGMKS
ncbi:hypothetical protein DFH06DRAFT_1255944 [Mycena polygramma]|nr:hypothetical protein DFH06DRAFT_1255944 [Mycena polygramma]